MSISVKNKQTEAIPITSSGASLDLASKKKTVSNKKKGGALVALLCKRMKERERDRRLDHAGTQAQKLPQLRTPIMGLRCFTTFQCSDHELLVQKYFNPLMSPSQSVAHLLTPLRSFAKKIPKTDPDFTFFIVENRKSEDTAGLCSSKTKKIHLMHRPSERSSETLLHELCHFAVSKMGWKSDEKRPFIRRINKAIAEDINAISASDWKTCDKIIKMKLFSVQAHYEKQKHWDEYIARVPQIISRMAKAHPQESYSQIEARLKKDIPHLFKIYKEEFLPQLCAYVARSNGVGNVKRVEDGTEVLKELRSRRHFQIQAKEAEALKDKQVVGLNSVIPQELPKPSVPVVPELVVTVKEQSVYYRDFTQLAAETDFFSMPHGKAVSRAPVLQKSTGETSPVVDEHPAKRWDFMQYTPSKPTLFLLGVAAGVFILVGRLRK